VPHDPLPRGATRHRFGTLHVKERRIPLTVASGDQSARCFRSCPATAGRLYQHGHRAFIQRAFDQAPRPTGLLTGMVYRDADRPSSCWKAPSRCRCGAAMGGTGMGIGKHSKRACQSAGTRGDVPLFLNGVGGLGAPYWVAEFDSRLVGDGEAWHKAVALVESIVFLLQTNLELMQKLRRPRCGWWWSGGLARYDGLCQRLSDLSGLALYRPAEHEATARGTGVSAGGISR